MRGDYSQGVTHPTQETVCVCVCVWGGGGGGGGGGFMCVECAFNCGKLRLRVPVDRK